MSVVAFESWIRPSLRGLRPYAPPARGAGSELQLDLNEAGPLVPPQWLERAVARMTPDLARRYPDASSLEATLAGRLGVSPDRVVVTNGGDDAIDRICRICLEPGDEVILPSPSFEMFARSIAMAGGACVRVPWPDSRFPVRQVLGAVGPRTRLIVVVSPNNPTGAVITAEQLRQVTAAAPGRLIAVDQAYTAFADRDLTPVALSLPNAVVVRSFSKDHGLAGLRVGYAAGSAGTVMAIRAAGGPFPCSWFSLMAAEAALSMPPSVLAERVARVRRERAAIEALLRERGIEPVPSQGNFVFARFPEAAAVHADLGRRGVRVKRFADPNLADAIRIGLPGDAAAFDRLVAALAAALTAARAAAGIAATDAGVTP